MFDEAIYDIETMFDVGVENRAIDALHADIKEEIVDFVSAYEGEERLTTDDIDEYFSEELDLLWAVKYPSRELYDVIEELASETDLDFDPYSLYYLNQVQTSIVANLLYASAIISKWEQREEPIDEALVNETCEKIFNKKLVSC